MSLKLYAHPFSSYCQKVLIALYENETPFEFRMLAPDERQAADELAALWPLRRMPVLVDGGRTVVESQWTRRGPTTPSSRSERPIGIDCASSASPGLTPTPR